MKMQKIPHTDYEVSRIVCGCMGIGGDWEPDSPLLPESVKLGRALVDAALECGINFFDHADIYCAGKAERVFGELIKDGLKRDGLVIQTKCGIQFGDQPTAGEPHRYNFSYEHITESVDGSLKRLRCDYIDILLLHRPDPLMEPEEIARAFDKLHSAGKVRHFGVSNFVPWQLEMLQRAIPQKLVANQIQLSLVHSQPIDSGLVRGYTESGEAFRGDDTVDYCRLNNISVQAYSPLGGGKLGNPKDDDTDKRVVATHDLMSEMAEHYGVSTEALAIAWLLRHPAKIQPIVGTSKAERLRALCEADKVELTRSDWYRLWQAGRGAGLP